MDIAERRVPQDGRLRLALTGERNEDYRVNSLPTLFGEKLVLRRLDALPADLSLAALGLGQAQQHTVETAIRAPHGLVLVTGPTGSGKTLSLYCFLQMLNTESRNVCSVEDPAEIQLAGINQVSVREKAGLTFAVALRAFLRQDPDVIMVGEIRDEETAEIAVEASLTGHLVLSTLHTNSAPETVTRLLDMGMDPFNFADSLLAVLAQRLVRRLCPSCRKAEPMPDEKLQELLDDYLHVFSAENRPTRESVLAQWQGAYGQPGLLHYHSPGCAKCDNTGFKGRAGLHELLVVSRTLRRLIQTGSRAEELMHQGMAEGMRTLRQDGITKVLQGVTTLSEVRATSNQ